MSSLLSFERVFGKTTPPKIGRPMYLTKEETIGYTESYPEVHAKTGRWYGGPIGYQKKYIQRLERLRKNISPKRFTFIRGTSGAAIAKFTPKKGREFFVVIAPKIKRDY